MIFESEIMLCDFTVGVKPVSFLNLFSAYKNRHPPKSHPLPGGPQDTWPTPKEPDYGEAYRVTEAGSRHNHFPGETRVKLDYSRLISFYDTSLFPNLQADRRGKGRWDHRLENINKKEVDSVMNKLDAILKEEQSPSRVDWKTLFQVLVDRFAERLEVLEYILNTTTTSHETVEERLGKAHRYVTGMLAPYTLLSAVPPKSLNLDWTSANHSWAVGVFEECATTHTRYLDEDETLSLFTPSEHLLLGAVKDVLKEICRVVVRIWAEGEEVLAAQELGLQSGSHSGGDPSEVLLNHWSESIQGLISWLDWSFWVRCRPACSFEVSRIGHPRMLVIPMTTPTGVLLSANMAFQNPSSWWS